MDERATAVFAAIIETRSLTVIHYTAADEAKKAESVHDRALFDKIMQSNSLDEIWIICHERVAAWHLFYAGEIRKFLDSKKGKWSK